jgi:four helix bundle protein
MRPNKFRLDDFELYQIARAFRRKMYSVARQLPDSEKISLNPQIRRAALSVTNNIAEGHGRWYYVDNARFCRTARGSVEELIDDLNTCLDEKYGDSRVVQALKDEAYQLIERINGYIAYLRRTQQGRTKPPDTRRPDTRPPCA